MKTIVIERIPGETCYVKLTDFLMATGLVQSKSEAKRLIQQGAIDINGRTTRATWLKFCDESISC